MASTIKHRKINIITLEQGETVADHCRAGDIVLMEDKDGWWISFIGEDGEIDSYDIPYDSYNRALGAAKAAAEFEAEHK